MPSIAIAWFRRDLRLHDHPALTAALEAADTVIPVFVFDESLLAGRFASANRAWFMRESVVELARALEERGSMLRVARGRPVDMLPALARESGADQVFVTRDWSPYGLRRDRAVADRLTADGVTMRAAHGLYVH